MYKMLATLLILILLCVSCSDKTDSKVALQTADLSVSSNQKILFEFWNENYAWGYSSSGFFINDEGDIVPFHTLNEYAKPQHDGPFTEEELLKKYALNPGVLDKIGQIELRELSAMKALIQSASQGELVEKSPNILATDIGSFYLIAYLYDEVAQSYEPVILAQDPYSAPPTQNNSVEADEIIDWLLTLEIDVESMFYPRVFNLE